MSASKGAGIRHEGNTLIEQLKATNNYESFIYKLFPNQTKAIPFIKNYLEKYDKEKGYSALLRMPTGTGKSGITAIVSHFFPEITHTLIIVPSIALIEQMIEDLQRKFWEKIGYQPEAGPKPIFRLTEGVGRDAIDFMGKNPKGVNIVSTPNAVTELYIHNWLDGFTGYLTQERIKEIRKGGVNESYSTAYEVLKNGRKKPNPVDPIDLVIFDEGHKEPARTYAKAVRILEKPTILMSATPYRNDLRLFKIGPLSFDKKDEEDKKDVEDKEGMEKKKDIEYRCEYRFYEAVKEDLIRDIDFIPVEEDWKGDKEIFVKAVSREFWNKKQELIDTGINNPKMIIRCDSSEDIEDIHEEFIKQENEKRTCVNGYQALKVIAIHTNFDQQNNYEVKKEISVEVDDEIETTKYGQPPSKGKEYADVWVHQNMLSEGVDIPDFAILAFFTEYVNSRSIVQQLGRIIRNTQARKTKQLGYVITCPSSEVKSHWESYVKFEKSNESAIGSADILEKIFQVMPDWYYGGKHYRQPSDPKNEVSIKNDIRLRQSANVYIIPDDLIVEGENLTRYLDELIDELSEELIERNIVELTSTRSRNLDDNGRIIIGVNASQSPYLREGGFFDMHLFPFIILNYQNYLFYKGKFCLRNTKLGSMLEGIDPTQLENLLDFQNHPIKQVSLINGDLSDTAIRRKLIGSVDLSKSAPYLNDHFHFLSAAVGRYEDVRRRYVGFSRNTITDYVDELLTIDEFKIWVEAIAQKLKEDESRKSALFNRYAPHKNPENADDLVPAHLLIELLEFNDSYRSKDLFDHEDIFPEYFNTTECDVKARDKKYYWKAEFPNKLMGNPEDQFIEIEGTISYSDTRKRFIIESDDLNKTFRQRNQEDNETKRKTRASTFLSGKAPLRVITKSGLLYADGRFYDPQVPLWGEGRIENIGVLHPVDFSIKKEINSEKGKNGIEADTWEEGSIFRIIDQEDLLFQSAGWKKENTLLICEDMGYETADFIAIEDSETEPVSKIATIHAKYAATKNGNLTYSATKFKEVSSQVVKNLGLLDPFNPHMPDLERKWAVDWKKKFDSGTYSLGRVRRPQTTAKDAFDKFQNVLSKPSTIKEIWIVYAKGFSISELERELDKDLPPYKIIQLVYLMHNCNSAVGSIGAKLRIFSSE